MFTRTPLALGAGALLFCALTLGTAQAQTSAPAPKELRASRNTYSPVMDVLNPARPRATDEQLQRLKALPIEAVWGAIQAKGYRQSFATGFRQSHAGEKAVGRALTMRYLPVRPDLQQAVETIAREGDWDFQYNVRAGEDARPGDMIVVELGGAVDRATFMGDVTGLGIQLAGVNGVVIDGGLRDLNEFLTIRMPVFYVGSHASAMADQVGVEWNAPVRVMNVTVLPGDIVIADASGVLFFPPQMADEVIKAAENTVYVENFKREMIRTKKYRTRDIYPKLSPEMERVFEEWKRTHPAEANSKPNVQP